MPVDEPVIADGHQGSRRLPAGAGGDQCRPRQVGRHHPIEWITERTGIKERRIAAEGELTSTMGAIAARRRSMTPGMAPEDIDLIILATSTPDQTFPATAVTIQAELGITQGAAFDVQAVCSGFVFALTTADNYLKSGAVQPGIGDRLRSLLPHPRLGGSLDLRPVRRRRRRASWSKPRS